MSAVTNFVGSLFGGSSSGAGASNTSSTQSLDPAIRDLFLSNYSNVKSAASGLTPVQYAAPTAYQNAAATATQNLTNGAAKYIDPAQVTNLGISSMMNPYISNVVNSTLTDLNRSRQMAMNDNNAAAVRAGAFGGSRQAVQNALTNEAYDRNTASTLANLYSQGYDTALGAAQYNAGNQQAANLANQSSYYQNANLGLGAANQLYNIGQGYQSYNQNVANAGRQNLLDQIGLVNQALGVNPLGGSGVTSSQSGVTQGKGLLSGLFG